MGMATVVATEAFPGVPSQTPSKPASGAVTQSTTANGTKIAVRESAGTTSSVKFTIGVGSNGETPCQKGAAHLLGVTAFAGTGKRSGLALIRALDDLGAQVTASSCRTRISYGVTMPGNNADAVLGLVSEAVASAPPAYVYREMMGQAVARQTAAATCPASTLLDLVTEAAYGDASPLGNGKYGGASPESVADFRTAHYKSGNLIITGSGVSADSLTNTASAMGLASGSTNVASSTFQSGFAKSKTAFGSNANVAVAFPHTGAASTVLSEHIATKLCVTPLTGAGIFGFYCNGSPAQVQASLTAIASEMKAVAAGASTANAATAVAITKAMALEGSNAADALVEVVMGTSVSAYTGMTASNVSAAAASAMKAGPAYAVLGSIVGTPDHHAVSSLFK